MISNKWIPTSNNKPKQLISSISSNISHYNKYDHNTSYTNKRNISHSKNINRCKNFTFLICSQTMIINCLTLRQATMSNKNNLRKNISCCNNMTISNSMPLHLNSTNRLMIFLMNTSNKISDKNNGMVITITKRVLTMAQILCLEIQNLEKLIQMLVMTTLTTTTMTVIPKRPAPMLSSESTPIKMITRGQ